MLKQKVLSIIAFTLLLSVTFSYFKNEPVASIITTKSPEQKLLYQNTHLNELGLTPSAYQLAMAGYQNLLSAGKIKNEDILTIIDFSLPSTAKRLFVIDIKLGTVLFNTYVSHGRNSGIQSATSFSNNPESLKSSLGFYTTAATYSGKHGYSLKLEGQEKGFNDNAFSRGIVMHSAAYVNESLINSQGFIGRSLGCPALPESLHKAIIEVIKDGSCLFIYAPDKTYLTHSAMVHYNGSVNNRAATSAS